MKQAIILLILLALGACNTHYQPNPDNDIGKGSFPVPCDTVLCSLMLQQKAVFENIFDSADVELQCMSEKQVLEKLLSGEERCAVLNRMLTRQEIEQIQTIDSAQPRQHIIAYDAIAIISSHQSVIADSSFSYEELIDALVDGKMNGISNVNFIFDNNSPGIAAFLKNEVGSGRNFAANVFALSSADAVIKHVAGSVNSIGFIPYSMFSDSEEKSSADVLMKVKSLHLKQTDSSGVVRWVSANQSDVASGDYPMKRGLNIVICNPRKRVVVGFVNFLHQQKAARVFLKAGLVPRYIPEREILIDTSLINQ